VAAAPNALMRACPHAPAGVRQPPCWEPHLGRPAAASMVCCMVTWGVWLRALWTEFAHFTLLLTETGRLSGVNGAASEVYNACIPAVKMMQQGSSDVHGLRRAFNAFNVHETRPLTTNLQGVAHKEGVSVLNAKPPSRTASSSTTTVKP